MLRDQWLTLVYTAFKCPWARHWICTSSMTADSAPHYTCRVQAKTGFLCRKQYNMKLLYCIYDITRQIVSIIYYLKFLNIENVKLLEKIISRPGFALSLWMKSNIALKMFCSLLLSRQNQLTDNWSFPINTFSPSVGINEPTKLKSPDAILFHEFAWSCLCLHSVIISLPLLSDKLRCMFFSFQFF